MSYEWIDHGLYWELKIPQGEQGWLNGRYGRTTTSTSGNLAGISKFKTPEEQGKIIAGVVQESFTQEELDRMNHGTKLETPARVWYSRYSGYNIVERGLIVPKSDYTMGASVDGDIVGTDGIIEIKCPVAMYYPLKQYMDQKKAGWIPRSDYVKHIWPTHLAQMYHAMWVMGKKWCMYIVYSTMDQAVFTQKIDFDPVYWDNHYKIITENYAKYVKPYLNGEYPIMPPY